MIENGTKNGDLEQVEDIYYYQGSNPNNWIQFKDVNDENALWRIISIENSVIKIIRNQSLGPMAWDQTGGKYGNPSWTHPADIHTYLNETYYNSLPTIIKNQLEDTKFYIGIIGYSSTHATSSSIRGGRTENYLGWKSRPRECE